MDPAQAPERVPAARCGGPPRGGNGGRIGPTDRRTSEPGSRRVQFVLAGRTRCDGEGDAALTGEMRRGNPRRRTTRPVRGTDHLRDVLRSAGAATWCVNVHGVTEVAGLDGDEVGYLLGKIAEIKWQ